MRDSADRIRLPLFPILLAVAAAGAFSQPQNAASWASRSGPPGGRALALIADGNDLFAATGPGGVFRLAGGAGTWQPVHSGLERQFATCLALSGGNLLAGTRGGLFALSPARKEWARVPGVVRKSILSLLTGDSLVLAGTDTSILRSTDAGKTWDEIGLEEYPNVFALARQGRYFFAGSENGQGVLRSGDRGLTWSLAGQGLPLSQGISVHALLGRPTGLFAGTTAGLFVSRDSGSTWSKVIQGLPSEAQFTALAGDGSTLYAGSRGNGAFQSLDEGASWTSIAGLGPEPDDIAALLPSDGDLWIGTRNEGVFHRAAGQSAWHPSNTGLGVILYTMACDGEILAAASQTAVFVSRDRAATWTRVYRWVGTFEEVSVALWEGRLYFGTGEALWETDLGTAVPTPQIISQGRATPLARLGADLILERNGSLLRWVPGTPAPSDFAPGYYQTLVGWNGRLLGYGRTQTFNRYAGRFDVYDGERTTWTTYTGPDTEPNSLVIMDSLTVVARSDLRAFVVRTQGTSFRLDSLELPFRVSSFCRDGDRIYAGTAGHGIMEYLGQAAGIRRPEDRLPAKGSRSPRRHSVPRFSGAGGGRDAGFDATGRIRPAIGPADR